MNNTIHICFSRSTRRSISTAISTNLLPSGSITCLFDDLSKGPISNINDIATRVNWNNNFDFSYRDIDINSQLSNSYTDFYNAIENISNEDVFIWYGDNCLEICGLLYTLTLLNIKPKKLNFARVLPTFTPDYNSATIYKGTYEVPSEKLGDIFNKSFKLTSNEISSLINLWTSLVKKNTNFRFLNRPNVDHRININGSNENKWPSIIDKYFINPVDAINKIKSDNEDYYDDLILQKLTSNSTKALSVIGTIISENNDSIYDTFIFYRILQLIKLEKIQYVGNLNSMRDLEIHL